MPTIDISYKDLCNLVGKQIPIKELKEDAILYAKGEIEEIKGDVIKVDIKDTNRPDLWSTEGIAREIKARYKPKFPEYKTKKSSVIVHVDPKLKNIRPYTTCAVVRNLKITDDVLAQMIQLQEKVAGTFGRNRKEVAIGVYDLHRIKPPIKFTTTTPTGLKFTPLDFSKPMTPEQILEQHPKGKEFGYLLKNLTSYPVFIDSNNEVLSIPPIINSDYTGKVTKQTKDVFIECSGFRLEFLQAALNVIVTALADRKGSIETVDVFYGNKKTITPDLTPKETGVSPDYIKKLSGLELSNKEIISLLEKSLYKIKQPGKTLKLLYPAYRQDIMHQSDVAEDIIISYGYNRIEPVIPKLPTTGQADELESQSSPTTEILTGLGLQEILSYTLTSKQSLFANMNLPVKDAVEIANPISSNWSVFRTWLLPSLLEFLSKNKHREFPQRIFEIGDVVVLDPKKETRTRDTKKMAVAISDNTTGYEDISSILDTFLNSLGIKYKLERSDHDSFIKGRTAKILVKGKEVGFIGEVTPLVLNKWKLDNPVAALEIDLEKILNI